MSDEEVESPATKKLRADIEKTNRRAKLIMEQAKAKARLAEAEKELAAAKHGSTPASAVAAAAVNPVSGSSSAPSSGASMRPPMNRAQLLKANAMHPLVPMMPSVESVRAGFAKTEPSLRIGLASAHR